MKFSEEAKNALWSLIDEMSLNLSDFTMHPDKDFTRKKKWDFPTLMKFIISMESQSLYEKKNQCAVSYGLRELFERIFEVEGFYVRAKPNDCTPDQTIKYITRYLGRPVIAASRIDHYDGEQVRKTSSQISFP